MLDDLRKAAPWLGVYMLAIVVLISAMRATRDCLLHHQLSKISIGMVHRVGTSFWGLYCERADAISLRPAIFD